MDEDCTIYKTVDFIGKRWTLLILLELYKGESKTKRYTEIKRALDNITPKILSLRLKELTTKNLISKRIDTSKFPIKCEYTLTESGMDFINIIKDIKKWALKWNTKSEVCESIDCEECKL